MGFGLHVGWAIEGAIGSDFKIDASYLSPNVNMASRLEAATKQFGVPLLVSGKLFDILTEKTQTYMRHIDTVTVKGSNEPIGNMSHLTHRTFHL
jgi:class 3 adenylate cyclase